MNDKIRTVIIDDEETAIDNLCFELKKYPWISVGKHTIFRLDAHYSQTYLCAITK